MPANMPKDASPGHPRAGAADAGYSPPAWLGPVKVAVVVMSTLIVLGIGLLVYGFASGIGKLADTGGEALRLVHPAGMDPVHAAPTADGGVMIVFEGGDGARQVVIIDPDGRRITGRITLEPGAGDFRIGD